MNHAAIAFFLAAGTALAQPVTIEWSTVGNPGNAPDPATGDLYGAVAYEFRIARHEITNDQYAAFLNAVAASDPYNLYEPFMGMESRGGITRSGAPGSYTYTIRPNMGNKPVNWVSWYDAARMANWITNGQGLNGTSGDTETGVYTFTGLNTISAINRDPANPDQVFIPTEDEWYKAAYHQPASQGGDSDNYWRYATQSNADPTIARATEVGDVSNPGPNVANYDQGADWNGSDGHMTTVGSAIATSYYGAFDMNGNVWEWNETLIDTSRGERGDRGDRGVRGGSRIDRASWLRAFTRRDLDPALASSAGGFRLATHALPPCPADVTGDRAVDLADLNLVLANFGDTTTIGDTNGDSTVDLADLNAILASFGQPCP